MALPRWAPEGDSRRVRNGGATPLVDPFDGLFRSGAHVASQGLLDHAEARRWFDYIAEVHGRDEYVFQQPLDGVCGPHVTIGGRRLLMLSAYDYLGLLGHPTINAAAVEAVATHGTGTGGVRMLTGTISLHRDLESEIARTKGVPAALVFSSGYLAAIGAVTALFGPQDRVVADELTHRSVIDACRLAGVRLQRFRHNDAASLDAMLARDGGARRTLVAVEGVYSMEGDVCPLPGIVEATRRRGACLMVDEAHSFGVLGATGRGVDEHFGVPADAVDLWIGSLSKAIPANGGFVAGSRELVAYLEHGAAPFMFSAALCPAATAAARAALCMMRSEPWRLARLRRNAARLRDGLRETGYDTGGSETCVIPVIVGRDGHAMALSRALLDHGIAASAVVHPAVARGGSRLRLCATAAHSDDDIDEALHAFRALAPEFVEPAARAAT